MKFTKSAFTFAQQVELLKSRGLIVSDDARALRWLTRVSYYRLSAYFIPFRKHDGTEDFVAGTELDAIIDVYKFDARLRVLFMQIYIREPSPRLDGDTTNVIGNAFNDVQRAQERYKNKTRRRIRIGGRTVSKLASRPGDIAKFLCPPQQIMESATWS